MKKFQSFEDFSQALRDEQVPSIDINMIKDVTTNMPADKSRNGRKKLMIVTIAAILVLCVGTVVFAADTIVSKWQLLNPKGDVAWEYTKNILTDIDALKSLDADSYIDEIAKNIKPHLKKGEGAIIVTKEKNLFLEYEEYVDDVNILKQQSTFEFKIPKQLPAGYRFVNGMLAYQYDNSNLPDLTEKAKQSKVGYVIEKVQLKPDVRQVRLKYSNGTRGLSIHIQKFQGNNLSSYCSVNYNTEVLKIGDIEVIHDWFTDKSAGMYFLVDEYENQKWLYTISTSSLTNDEIVNLIESIEF